MYAHVNTARLGSEAEVMSEVDSLDVISDQSARTIASWWHAPSEASINITRLSHGMPFDTDGLRDEVEREMKAHDSAALPALLQWVENLETLSSEDGTPSILQGDTLLTHVDHVSKSGLTRWIQVYLPREGREHEDVTEHVAEVLGLPLNTRGHSGVQVGGTGMDMGFHLIYRLSSRMFNDGYAISQGWL